MLEVLPWTDQHIPCIFDLDTHDNTFEKSFDGDITKLSLLFDQDIRCRME